MPGGASFFGEFAERGKLDVDAGRPEFALFEGGSVGMDGASRESLGLRGRPGTRGQGRGP